MGRQLHRIEIEASVSRHNDPERDGADDAKYAELVAEIREILKQDKYADIRPEIVMEY